jgi:hypothetical protein
VGVYQIDALPPNGPQESEESERIQEAMCPKIDSVDPCLPELLGEKSIVSIRKGADRNRMAPCRQVAEEVHRHPLGTTRFKTAQED